VSARHDRLLDQRHGWPTLLLCEQEIDPGLIATLREDLIPWLETNLPIAAEQQRHLSEDPRAHRFTAVFDREGYSPALFRELWEKRIAVLTYHKHPGEPWPEQEFQTHRITLIGGETVNMQLAERGSQL
jgi:hypothetical protein